MQHRILVADDNLDVAESASALLSLDGYSVIAVHDGRQAIEIARTFHPHLAILDISMPVVDGYEAARALRREHMAGHRLILVAHTAMVQRVDVEQARLAGFNYHLAKPVVGYIFCDLIGSYLLEGDDKRDLQRRH